jgi:hypothetical protein
MYKKLYGGQSSTEFLFLTALALTTALVTIALLGWFSGSGGETQASESKLYWASATPLSITSIKVSDFESKVTVVNRGLNPINLTQISFDGNAVSTMPMIIQSGEEKTILVSAYCTESKKLQYQVTLQYDEGAIKNLKQTGVKPVLTSCSKTNCQLPTNGLVALWRFKEGSGTTTADDSGNGNAGSLVGGASWASGKLGYGLQLDGSTGYVNLGNKESLGITGDISIFAWTKFASSCGVSSYCPILTKTVSNGDNRNPYDFRVEMPLKLALVRADNTSYAQILSTSSFATNTWTHVGVTSNQGAITFYIDATQAGTGAIALQPTNNTSPALMGRRADNLRYQGTIDEMAVWNRALNASEIQQVYDCGQH